ncbi:hypothetical protein EDB87DRAFT_1581724 [Lactarius vividus]|nr:hypothetical protein EDB87DRAFT_1581724 [Lactarius vividus]
MTTSGVLRKALRRDACTAVETTARAVLNHMNITRHSDHSADAPSQVLIRLLRSGTHGSPVVATMLTAVSNSQALRTIIASSTAEAVERGAGQAAAMRNAPSGWQLSFPQPPWKPLNPRSNKRGRDPLGTIAAWLLYEIKASEGTSISNSPLNVGSRMLGVKWTRTCAYSVRNKLGVPVVGKVSGLAGPFAFKATLRDVNAPVEILSQTNGSYYPNLGERIRPTNAPGPGSEPLSPWTQHSYITLRQLGHKSNATTARSIHFFTSAFSIRR